MKGIIMKLRSAIITFNNVFKNGGFKGFVFFFLTFFFKNVFYLKNPNGFQREGKLFGRNVLD